MGGNIVERLQKYLRNIAELLKKYCKTIHLQRVEDICCKYIYCGKVAEIFKKY